MYSFSNVPFSFINSPTSAKVYSVAVVASMSMYSNVISDTQVVPFLKAVKLIYQLFCVFCENL